MPRYGSVAIATPPIPEGDGHVELTERDRAKLCGNQIAAIIDHAKHSAREAKSLLLDAPLLRDGDGCSRANCRICREGGPTGVGSWAVSAVCHPDLMAAAVRVLSVPRHALPIGRSIAVAFYVAVGVPDALSNSCGTIGASSVLPVEALFACYHPVKVRFNTAVLECELRLDKAIALARADGCALHVLAILGDTIQAGPYANTEELRTNARIYSTLSEQDIDKYVANFTRRSSTTVFVGGGAVSRIATVNFFEATGSKYVQKCEYRMAVEALRAAGVVYDAVSGYRYTN